MVRLPYTPRPGQEELAHAVGRVQQEGGHLLAEAGTGTGKTVAVLAASLESRARDGRVVVWATRTNSQQAQVLRERARLAAAGDPAEAPLVVPFMGRRHYCPLLRDDARYRDGTPEELGRLCRDAKRKAVLAHESGKPVEGACAYYMRLLRDGPDAAEALLRAPEPDATAAAAQIEKAGSCPYEAYKLLIPRSGAVLVPYIYVIDDRLRATLMQWLGTGPDGCHLVIDEAHNLPSAARSHHTPRLGGVTLARAQKEAAEWHDPVLAGQVLTTTLLDTLSRAMGRMAGEFIQDGEDALVPPGVFEEELLRALRLPTPALRAMATELEVWGETVREDRRAKGRLPRSYLGAVGAFLHAWVADLDGERVSIVAAAEEVSLERFLLDPVSVLGWLQEFWSTVHMSGTLAPLEEHARVCGFIPGTATLLDLGDPYQTGQLQVACVEGLHRRHDAVRKDPGLTARQQEWAIAMLSHWPGRCALWFPSHQMLAEYLEEGFLHAVGRPLFVERPDMPTAALQELVGRFCREPTPGALLLGVLGGRLTEGIDYPGDALEAALLFGVPYPKPSARSQALIHHYDRVTGNGWSVAVHTPVGRVMRQAVGRLVRGPQERGVAVILDERAIRFHQHLRNIRTVRDPKEVVQGAGPSGYRRASEPPQAPRQA